MWRVVFRVKSDAILDFCWNHVFGFPVIEAANSKRSQYERTDAMFLKFSILCSLILGQHSYHQYCHDPGRSLPHKLCGSSRGIRFIKFCSSIFYCSLVRVVYFGFRLASNFFGSLETFATFDTTINALVSIGSARILRNFDCAVYYWPFHRFCSSCEFGITDSMTIASPSARFGVNVSFISSLSLYVSNQKNVNIKILKYRLLMTSEIAIESQFSEWFIPNSRWVRQWAVSWLKPCDGRKWCCFVWWRCLVNGPIFSSRHLTTFVV